MSNHNYTHTILGLEDIIVTNVKNEQNTLHIYLQMEQRIHTCPTCGQSTSKVHDYRVQVVKELSAFGRLCFLHVRKRRHVCPACGKRFAESVPFLPKYHRITSRLFAYLLEEFRNVASMKSVAVRSNVSQTTASRVFDHVNYPKPKLPSVLSIDEFRGNAEGEKFQCILTDPVKKQVLDILPKRKLEDLCEYFSSFPNRKEVKYVVMDMSPLFRSMARSCFPKAIIVADKYHVVRQVTWAFEAVRKTEQKKFGNERRKYFKRSRKLLLKHSSLLTGEEAAAIEQMLRISERLRQAYLVKRQFEKFMACKDSDSARKELSKWIVFTQSYQLPEFSACCKTFTNWSREILAFFDCSYTNGYTEGVNNKIKVLKRNAYGIRKFQRFRNRILHIMAS